MLCLTVLGLKVARNRLHQKIKCRQKSPIGEVLMNLLIVLGQNGDKSPKLATLTDAPKNEVSAMQPRPSHTLDM